MKISKKTKQKIEKASERYANHRHKVYGYDRDYKSTVYDEAKYAFIKGIEWYLKNQDKLSQEEALDEWAKICKE